MSRTAGRAIGGENSDGGTGSHLEGVDDWSSGLSFVECCRRYSFSMLENNFLVVRDDKKLSEH